MSAYFIKASLTLLCSPASSSRSSFRPLMRRPITDTPFATLSSCKTSYAPVTNDIVCSVLAPSVCIVPAILCVICAKASNAIALLFEISFISSSNVFAYETSAPVPLRMDIRICAASPASVMPSATFASISAYFATSSDSESVNPALLTSVMAFIASSPVCPTCSARRKALSVSCFV